MGFSVMPGSAGMTNGKSKFLFRFGKSVGKHGVYMARVCMVIWEYIVRAEMREEFERIYASNGQWVDIFAEHVGFLETRLLRDADNDVRYITVDYWASPNDYSGFLAQRGDDYKALDDACERLTVRETRIGVFE